MANSDAKKQNSSIYYNIDIYNDNSTNGDISSKFQTAFNSPLLMDTSNYEVAVARARIPCDQIPLSQENLPFQKWQIEIGVPSLATPPTYTYYNSYVPQFNPNSVPSSYTNTAVFGVFEQSLKLLTITSDTSTTPTTESGDEWVFSETVMPSVTPIYQSLCVGGTSGYTFISNVTYTLDYIVSCTQNIISRYTYAGVLYDTNEVATQTSVIRGICASQLRNNIYYLAYDSSRSPQWYLYNLFGGDSVNLTTQAGDDYAADSNIYSFVCSGSRIALSIVDRVVNGGEELIIPLVFDIEGAMRGFPRVNPNQTSVTGPTYFYLDDINRYYALPLTWGGFAPYFTQTDIPTCNSVIQTFNFPSPLPNFAAYRILGSDKWDNLLVMFSSIGGNPTVYTIFAYNKTTGGNPVYFLNMGNNPILSMTNFTTTYGPLVPAPSLTPNYPVMTINEYLRQINLAFVSIFNQIPTPLSSPSIAPRLIFDSAGVGIVSIVCDPGCASSLSTACVINFNQLLWSFFKFNSIQAVNTAIGGSRTITINNAVPGKNSITAQPNPTLYRFSDLTRIIISTSRMGILGDNEGNNKLLVNIGDFTVDTESGIPNLVIYNPVILRFYKLYQNMPLTNIDVFISYANRAGTVFPVSISPYNSIGLKLEFKRIPLEMKSVIKGF